MQHGVQGIYRHAFGSLCLHNGMIESSHLSYKLGAVSSDDSPAEEEGYFGGKLHVY